MEILEAIFAAIVGFNVYNILTHPKKLKSKMPKIGKGAIQIWPNFQISFKKHTIWIHHWISTGLILTYINHISHGADNLEFIKFFAIGGIIQGISFKDRFNIFVKHEQPLSRWPYISVVIPAYNEAKSLVKTLESLHAQDYLGNFEIIVVDNNSTDSTAKVAKKYGAKVIFEPRKGVAFARQTGFMAATGEIIATSDSDTIVPPNWLTRFVKKFNKDPNAVLISGMFNFYDGSRFLNAMTYLLNYHSFVIFGWYSGANMAVKRDAFLKVGGFNTALPLSEDSDLGVRLRKIGHVTIDAKFKVKTSARRFNQLGFWGGIYDYCINYIKFKLHIKPSKVAFRSGSEVPRLGLVPRLAIHLLVILALAGALLGGIFEIKPVKAQVIKRGHQFSQHVPHMNLDIDMPNVNSSLYTARQFIHYVHHPR